MYPKERPTGNQIKISWVWNELWWQLCSGFDKQPKCPPQSQSLREHQGPASSLPSSRSFPLKNIAGIDFSGIVSSTGSNYPNLWRNSGTIEPTLPISQFLRRHLAMGLWGYTPFLRIFSEEHRKKKFLDISSWKDVHVIRSYTAKTRISLSDL